MTEGIEVYLPLKDLIDAEKETARLGKDLEKLSKEISRLSAKLDNEGFLKKAPENLVVSEREKLASYIEKKKSLEERIDFISKL